MEIRSLYKAILEAIGLKVNENGEIVMMLGDVETSSCIDNKQLVLPTQELLRKGIGDEYIAFHPISENIVRGESEVIKKLKTHVIFRISEIVINLMQDLIGAAADKDYHKKLSPSQTEILTLAPNADSKTVAVFEKIFDSSTIVGEKKIFSLYIKRGGEWKGNKYNRVAKAHFSITDEFDNGSLEIFGIKMKKADKEAFKKLFEYIVPKCESHEEYVYGSNSKTAPNFHCLLKLFCKVVANTNKIVNKYKKHLSDPEHLLVDISWEKELEDLSVYKDLIPTLKGNEGVGEVESEETVKPKSFLLNNAEKLNQINTGQQQVPQPVNQPTNVRNTTVTVVPVVNETKNTSGGLNWDSLSIFQNYTNQVASAMSQPMTRGGFAQQNVFNGGFNTNFNGFPATQQIKSFLL